jgi:hypothetical protein
MPPEDSHLGPLSASEKQAIRAWIEAGAPQGSGMPPLPAPGTAASLSAPTGAGGAGGGDAEPFLVHALHWAGRFHVLVIHFPIALLAAAAMLEGLTIFRRRRSPWSAVRSCVLLGAAGAVAAALLGWSRVSFGGYEAPSARVLDLHRWLGTAAGALAIAVAAASEGDARRGRRSLHFRVMLFGSALLVGAAAHFGGTLTHGDDYFTW